MPAARTAVVAWTPGKRASLEERFITSRISETVASPCPVVGHLVERHLAAGTEIGPYTSPVRRRNRTRW